MGPVATGGRIWSLDSLRGLAAVAVVIQHSLLLMPQFLAIVNGSHTGWLAHILGYSPLHLFWAGNEAVIIFYVLSGYVLSEQFWSGKQKPYLSFVTSRWFRLYPAYIVIVSIVAALSTVMIYFNGVDFVRWCSRLPGQLPYCALSDWRPLSAPIAAEHLVMYVPRPHSWLDPVLWSLIVEIQISMVFPLIILSLARFGSISIIGGIAVAALTVKASHYLPVSLATPTEPIVTSLTYAWYFVLGAELCRRKSLIASLSSKFSVLTQWCILTLGAAFLLKLWLFSFIPAVLTPIFWAAGASLIIVSVRHFPSVRAALEIPALRWVGERSYSLYLVHYPTMALLAISTWHRAPLWTVSVVLLPLSLFAAHWMYRYVERPGIAAGKLLENFLRASPSAATPSV
jgi:peptidoglycan/LPS O-acetylase OafA/YrhL